MMEGSSSGGDPYPTRALSGPLCGLPLLEDLPPIDGAHVLLRVDFNVPLGPVDDEGLATVEDDFRIKAALPTIYWLLDHGAQVTACTHLGRPKGDARSRLLGRTVAAGALPARTHSGARGEPPVRPGRDGERSEVRGSAGVGVRHVRERRLRGVSPSARVSSRAADQTSVRSGSSLRTRGRGPRRASARAPAAVRGDRRRREVVRQARGASQPPRPRGRPRDRRSDGVHVPARSRPQDWFVTDGHRQVGGVQGAAPQGR